MMKKISVLIVSSTTIGELIQQTLDDTGQYQVTRSDGASQALECARAQGFDIAVLDSEMTDGSLLDLASNLRQLHPSICLVAIPSDENLDGAACQALNADICLGVPFYLPELLDALNALPVGKQSAPEGIRPTGEAAGSKAPAAARRQADQPRPAPVQESPAWLKDVSLAAQHLTSLLLESAAQAALIVRSGALWAYAGELPREVAQELAEIVLKTQFSHAGSDLVRFLRLQTTGAEHMVYATSLGAGMILALAFDVETPFNKIRAQAVRLARILLSPPDATSVDAEPEKIPEADENPPYDGPGDGAEDEDLLDLPVRPLWDDVPPPTPDRFDFRAAMPAARGAESVDILQPPSEPVHRPSEQALADLDRESDNDSGVDLYPPTPALVNISFACVMLPRLPKHHLTGDLAAHLSEWVEQIGLAFGWRLEHIAVRPDYLQWIMAVPPTTSPSYLMRVMRQQTSQRIFAEFTAISQDNPSGDFWAPGYLIMSSTQLPPAQVIKDFIEQTRRHQGASKPISFQFRK